MLLRYNVPLPATLMVALKLRWLRRSYDGGGEVTMVAVKLRWLR